MATVEWRGDELVKAIEAGIRRGITAAGIEAQRSMQKVLSGTGSGRLYRRSRTRVHRASAPGEPPAKDTGTLGRSIQFTPAKKSGDTISTRIGPTVIYGAILELPSGLNRPYIRRSVRAAENRIERVFTRELKTAVRRFR